MSQNESQERTRADASSSERPGIRGGGFFLRPLILVLGVQVGLLSLILLLGSVYAPRPRMVALDSLALPGAATRLGVRLHTEPPDLLSCDVSGREVLLVSGKGGAPERELPSDGGVGITDDKGIAWLEVQAPEAPGLHEFLATPKRPDSFPVDPPAVSVFLEVIHPRRSLLFVLLPSTLDADLQIEPPGPGDTRPFSMAAEALRDLDRYLDIVYLVEPRWRNASALRSRLRRRGFPSASILGRGVGLTAGSPTEVVKNLELSRWKGSHWAVVTEHADARAMRLQGLRVVVLTTVSALGVDERRTFLAGSWGEARKKIIENVDE